MYHLAGRNLLEMLKAQSVEIGMRLNLVGLEGVDETPAVVCVNGRVGCRGVEELVALNTA